MIELEKIDIRIVLADIYKNACLEDSCDMRELSFVLESLAEVYLEYPAMVAWKKIKIDKGRFDKGEYYKWILQFRKSTNKRFLDKAVSEIQKASITDRKLAFDLWLEIYTDALVNWEGEVFGTLCEMEFDFISESQKIIEQYKLLNRFVVDEKWPEVYQYFLDFAENKGLPDSRRCSFYLYSAQIVLYYFGYPDIVEGLIDKAKKTFPGHLLISRVQAESLIVGKNFEKARSLLLNAINADPNHIENYNYLGDSYLNEQKFEAAEQWYNDALHINFMDTTPYSKLINLIGDLEDREGRSNEIERLLEKASSFLENNKFENFLYILHRDVGAAFNKMGEIEKSIQYYLKSIDLKPFLSSAKIELAYLYSNQSNFEEGEKWFAAAMVQDQPQLNFAVFWGFGWLYETGQLDKTQKALEFYQKCLGIRIIGDDRVYNIIGNLYFGLDDFVKSAEFYKKAIQEYPFEIVYHNNLKGALDEIGIPEDLKGYYEDLLTYFPHEAKYFNDAGVFQFKHGDYKKALELYHIAIELDSGNAVFWENKGLVFEKLKQYDNAILDYLKSLEIKEDAFVYNAVGKLKFWQGKNQEAVEFYSKAIQMEPEIPIYLENRALVFEKLQIYDQAENDVRKALSLEKTAARYNILGLVYYRKGKIESAVENYSLAIEIDPEVRVYWENRALAFENLNRYDEAVQDYISSIKLQEDAFGYNAIGRIKYWQGQFEEAIEYYSKAIELDSSRAVYFENRALAFRNNNNLDLAEKDLLKALSLEENGNILNHLGIIKLNKTQYEEAVSFFTKAINLMPNEFIIWENRALAKEALGWNEEAYADYEKALSILESPVSYNGLGKIKYWDSDFEGALGFFSKAVELDPGNEDYRNNLEMARQNTGLRPMG